MAYPGWKYKGHVTFADTAKAKEVQALVYIYYQTGMNSDFSDLRFAATDGTPLPYYFDYATAGSVARVWVRVPAGQTTINFYYGNAAATSESSGANTFFVFDEFNDANWADNWSGDTSYWTASGSLLKCSTSGKKIYRAVSGGLDDKAIYASIVTKANTNLKFGIVFRASWGEVQFTRSYTSTYPRRWSDGTYVSGSSPLWSDNTAAVDRVDIFSTKAATKYYVGNTSWTAITGPNTHTAMLSAAGQFGLYAYAPNTYQYVRWVRVQSSATLLNYTVTVDGANKEDIIESFALHITPSYGFTGKHYATRAVTIIPEVTPYETGLVLSPTAEIKDYLTASTGITVTPSTVAVNDSLYASTEVYVTPAADPLIEGMDLDQYPWTALTVRKSIADAMWQMDIKFEGHTVPPTQRRIFYDVLDIYGDSNRIFAGIIPEPDYVISDAANKTSVVAYDYAYYLSRQLVPYDETTIKLVTAYPTWGDWIEHLLEGTGITAYRIAAGPTTTAEFSLTPKTTKMQAIKKIADYLGYLFLVSWDGDDAIAYFIDPANIDEPASGLDLPDQYDVYITDGTLVGIPSAKPVSEKTYNRIIVRGRDPVNNVYLTSVAETDRLTGGYEYAREYYEESLNYTTQAICDTRAAFLLAGLSTELYTVRATFKLRHDFRLWQKIRFLGDGFPAAVTNMGVMRIVNISHSIQEADSTVTIECTVDQDISLISELADVFDSNTVSETVGIVNNKFSTQAEIQAGTITAISGTTATVLLENGNTIQARLLE